MSLCISDYLDNKQKAFKISSVLKNNYIHASLLFNQNVVSVGAMDSVLSIHHRDSIQIWMEPFLFGLNQSQIIFICNFFGLNLYLISWTIITKPFCQCISQIVIISIRDLFSIVRNSSSIPNPTQFYAISLTITFKVSISLNDTSKCP